MKKKILLFMFISVLIITLTGCGSNNNVKKPVDNGKSSNTSENESTVKSNKKAKIDETVILDKDGVKVTAKSIDYDGWLGPEIKVLIENNSTQNITIQAEYFCINGIMVNPSFSPDIAAGKKANSEISLSSSELEKAKIATIKDIEFGLRVFNSGTWKDIFKVNEIKLTTDATDYEQVYNTEGKLVVNQKDVKIYVLKLDDNDSWLGADVYVYIENNSTQDITVQVRDVSINGFMADPIFSSDVKAGKRAYDSISFLESTLKDNDIKSIDEIELKFNVSNAHTWNTIFKTDTQKITFEE